MDSGKKSLRQEIWAIFRKQQNVFLATVEGDQPRVRPVTLIRLRDRLFFATGSENAKVKQIVQNSKTEFCLMFGQEGNRGIIRSECRAKIVKDQGLRTEVYRRTSLLSEFWESPEEASYVLVELEPAAFEYTRPRGRQAVKMSL